MYYSKTTGGFYSEEINGKNIPPDSVEITDEKHQELLVGQQEGMVIAADENGYPKLIPLLLTLTYADKRLMEYPPVTDYIDGVVKGDQVQIDTYIATCRAVKSKYPKP